jgi:hypothetical protein
VNLKKIASVSLIGLSALTLAGCSLSNNVASLEPYAPSDGVMVDTTSLKARNLLLIQGESGKAVLIGSFVSGSTQDVKASLQTLDVDGKEVRVEFAVAAGEKFDIGYNGTEAIALQLNAEPGSMHQVYLNDGTDPVGILVPVVDGSLEEYRSFAEELG